MSEEEEYIVVGRMVKERGDAKKHLSLLQSEARELSKLFTGLGSVVQPDKVWNISLESYQGVLSAETYEKITKLKTELRATEQNVAALNDELKKFDA